MEEDARLPALPGEEGPGSPPDQTFRDPWAAVPAPPPRPKLSGLAVTSILASLLGPIGAILAVIFGWHARREIKASGGRQKGFALATAGMALGVALTPIWGAGLCVLAWLELHRAAPVAADAPTPETEPRESARSGSQRARRPSVAPAPAPAPAPAAASEPASGPWAPKKTRVGTEGKITVVDLGKDVSSLPDALAHQRADAAAAGETLVVMTTAGRCEPCRGVDQSLTDPLLQSSLSKVRLVRVDLETFNEDLDGLRMPHERFPGFFLLAPDLTPRDGIDGGEWDDDIPANIAPVLGAFVRGKYGTRRQEWQPVPGSGMTL